MRSPGVVFSAKGKVELTQVEVPQPGPRDVVVRTKFSWISNGTGSSFLRCERTDGITPWLPSMPLPFPMVPGYQKVGVVEEVGAEVPGLKEGDWVLALPDNVEYAEVKSEAVKYSGLVLTQVGFNAGSRPPVKDGCPALVVGDGMVGQWAAQTPAVARSQSRPGGKTRFSVGLILRSK